MSAKKVKRHCFGELVEVENTRQGKVRKLYGANGSSEIRELGVRNLWGEVEYKK